MLLGRPNVGKVETINDADGFVANFWRAVSLDAADVAKHTDWPVNEADLFARHSWLVRQAPGLLERLHADPDYYDAKIAGWWCWGACNWIGSGWCSGTGPWVHDGEKLVDARQLPHLGNAGQGVNRKLPHLGDAGQGRAAYIREWFGALQDRTRNVRVAVGDWQRVLTESVTTRHGTTGVFLDPPYTKGAMDYAAMSFDGGGYTLSNLNVSQTFNNDIGLFGRLVNAEVKNLSLNTATVSGYANVGGLVGYNHKSTISDINVLSVSATGGSGFGMNNETM
jgi:hypothetical protein